MSNEEEKEIEALEKEVTEDEEKPIKVDTEDITIDEHISAEDKKLEKEFFEDA